MPLTLKLLSLAILCNAFVQSASSSLPDTELSNGLYTFNSSSLKQSVTLVLPFLVSHVGNTTQNPVGLIASDNECTSTEYGTMYTFPAQHETVLSHLEQAQKYASQSTQPSAFAHNTSFQFTNSSLSLVVNIYRPDCFADSPFTWAKFAQLTIALQSIAINNPSNRTWVGTIIDMNTHESLADVLLVPSFHEIAPHEIAGQYHRNITDKISVSKRTTTLAYETAHIRFSIKVSPIARVWARMIPPLVRGTKSLIIADRLSTTEYRSIDILLPQQGLNHAIEARYPDVKFQLQTLDDNRLLDRIEVMEFLNSLERLVRQFERKEVETAVLFGDIYDLRGNMIAVYSIGSPLDQVLPTPFIQVDGCLIINPGKSDDGVTIVGCLEGSEREI